MADNLSKNVVYHQMEPSTMLCGIPLESQSIYFEKGDIPVGYFEKNGMEYMVIYSFVLGKGALINEGGNLNLGPYGL